MQTFFTIIGYITAIVFMVLLIVGSIYGIIETLERRSMRIRDQAHTHACFSLGAYISACSYWFSEDFKAQKAIEILGKNMNKYGTIDWQPLRDEWREALKEADKTKDVDEDSLRDKTRVLPGLKLDLDDPKNSEA